MKGLSGCVCIESELGAQFVAWTVLWMLTSVKPSTHSTQYRTYHSTGNKFERFRGFLELISRFEFEFRRRENYFFFERFEFLVRSCECAVAFLCPRNSISNVVASAIHDDRNIHFNETIVEGHKHIHVHLHVHLHLHLHLFLHIHLHIHIYICIYTCTLAFACACARERERRGRGGEWCWVGRWVGGLVSMCWRVCVLCWCLCLLCWCFVSVVLVFPQDS